MALMLTLTIRDSEPQDAGAIQSIYAHHVASGRASFELTAPDLAEIRRRRDDVLANGFPYLVAEAAGRVIGYAYANFFRTRPAYRFTVENSIYIAHDAIGQGAGRRLLLALIERCEALGCRQMIAVIGDSGNTGSIALHAACGFRFAGVLRSSGWKLDQWTDTVLMQRALGLGDHTPPG